VSKIDVPLGLVVLNADVDAKQLEAELVALVRQEIGAVACFKEAIVVPRLPKTRSGEILRATMRGIVAGQQLTVPSTIEDPGALDDVAAAIKARN
jgi:propionyl-CoA synthetase